MRYLSIVFAFICATASAQRITSPDIDVSAVTIAVTWVSSRSELEAIARQVDAAAGTRLAGDRKNGLAVLFVLDDGAHVCRVYAFKPRDWNARQQMETLGHELMHCLGFNHD